MHMALILWLKAKIIRLDNKRPIVCYLQETHFKHKEVDMLKRKRKGKYTMQKVEESWYCCIIITQIIFKDS